VTTTDTATDTATATTTVATTVTVTAAVTATACKKVKKLWYYIQAIKVLYNSNNCC